MKIVSRGKTSGTRLKTDTSDLLLFQKQLDDRIRLFEEEKEMESSVGNQVKTTYLFLLRSTRTDNCVDGKCETIFLFFIIEGHLDVIYI